VQDASDWPEEKRRRFVIVDNGSWGENDWDCLANKWADLPMIDLGVDIPADWLKEPEAAVEDGESQQQEKPDIIICPKCGHEFSVLKKEK
jgi:hypothetical protein